MLESIVVMLNGTEFCQVTKSLSRMTWVLKVRGFKITFQGMSSKVLQSLDIHKQVSGP